MKPIVGITPSAQVDELAHGTFHRYLISAPYVRAVEASGAIPLVLPPQSDAADALADLLDALLLSGGADVAPARYGDASVHSETYGIDSERDAFEIELFGAMLNRNKPVLGICRGIQVINVALGGTLIQDIPSQHPGSAAIGHRQQERGLAASSVGHLVTPRDEELLPIFGDSTLGVNSFHHQAIRDLAPDLIPVAFSPDGLIEAVAMSGNRPVFAVQWHPELMFEAHPQHLRPFEHLAETALAWKLAFASS